MPIYEYRCATCGDEFELLVLGADEPACAACGGTDLERLLSLPRIQSDVTRARSQRAAKQRDARQADDRMRERVEYESNHD